MDEAPFAYLRLLGTVSALNNELRSRGIRGEPLLALTKCLTSRKGSADSALLAASIGPFNRQSMCFAALFLFGQARFSEFVHNSRLCFLVCRAHLCFLLERSQNKLYLKLLLGSTDKMSAQETHGGHIILALMAALVARAGGHAVNGSGERIAIFPMSALRDGPCAKPGCPAKQH
jgi:hypothetical protein